MGGENVEEIFKMISCHGCGQRKCDFQKKDYHHFSVCGYLLGTESHVGSWVAHKSSFHIIDDAESSHHKTQSRLISKYQSGSLMNVKVVKWCWKK